MRNGITIKMNMLNIKNHWKIKHHDGGINAKKKLKLEISASSDKYIISEPFIIEIKLTNIGLFPLYPYKYGFEIGLQLDIEIVDEEGNIILIPPLKDIEPDLSKDNFLQLAPKESHTLTEDISPILKSGLFKINQQVYIRILYTSKYYGEYAEKEYQINAFIGKISSNQLRMEIQKSKKYNEKRRDRSQHLTFGWFLW